MGLIISRSARIGVLDAVGQKIVFMRSDGTPDGEWQAILPDEHARLSPLFAWAVPRGILVSCQIRERTDAAAVHRDVIALFGEDRRLAQIACEKSRTHALDQPFVFDEAAMESYSFLAVREDGTVYLSPDFGAYQIDVFDPALHRTMIIERDCPRVRRTPEQVADVRANWEAFYRRVKNAEVRVEEHRRTILSLHPRADGTLWVETSAGWHHHPPNTCVALDVIDASGRFSHQVALAGRIDPWEDYLYLFEDRALVWTGGFSAVQGAIGAADHTPESAEEAEGPTLICYQLVPR
jgi:hypothetical protein